MLLLSYVCLPRIFVVFCYKQALVCVEIHFPRVQSPIVRRCSFSCHCEFIARLRRRDGCVGWFWGHIPAAYLPEDKCLPADSTGMVGLTQKLI